MKVAAPVAATPPAAPAPNMPAPAPDASGSDLDFGGEAAPTNDKPFDDQPFDAGVEADEDTDPKKFIEQLSGKIGQSLRKYTEETGQPDFELEKFAINSLLSATHTAEMDEDDRKDIIKKVNTAGGGDGNDLENSDMDGEENDSDMPDMGDENLQESEMGNLFLDGQGKRMSIFAPEGSDEFMEENRLDEDNPCWAGYEKVAGKGDYEEDSCRKISEDKSAKKQFSKDLQTDPDFLKYKEKATGYGVANAVSNDQCIKKSKYTRIGKEDTERKRRNENLIVSKKNSIFGKDLLKSKLHETFNSDDMSETIEPIVEPIVKPSTTPAPSRRSRPFTIDPDSVPQTDPKAMNENLNKLEVYHNTFSSAVQTAGEYAKSKGYELNDDEWFNTIATGPKKPQEGETNRYTLTLYKDGKEQRKALHIQVYGMKNKYELNTYIA